MTRNTRDPQRKITRWEIEASEEMEFNTRMSASKDLSSFEAMLMNMTDEEYLNFCDATGRA